FLSTINLTSIVPPFFLNLKYLAEKSRHDADSFRSRVRRSEHENSFFNFLIKKILDVNFVDRERTFYRGLTLLPRSDCPFGSMVRLVHSGAHSPCSVPLQ